MPPGTPHHSFLLPYRIRVDNFTSPRDHYFDPPALYLLSHTHSDHITGLSARSFGARVVCSVDAKFMLLNYEAAGDRVAFDNGVATEKRRPHSHLKIEHKTSSSSKHKTYSRDLLQVLPLNSPTTLELSDDVTVTLTLLDANHCPGAVMFLVEGPLGNFLHTGDFRADQPFLETLARNPWLQRYIQPPVAFFNPADASGEKPLRTLDAIHLDTACLLSHHELPSKDDACSGLVELVSLFPPLTRFFVNSWTWGYEDILKALGRAFNSKIHVDRYKFDIYSGISDPSLKSLLTLDADVTRFHACERKNRCDRVAQGTTGVVYINPVTLSRVKWDKYLQETRASLQRDEHVSSLLCPLSRHSSLPELQAFVKLFRPKLVVPNSLHPDLGCLDWACMPLMFRDCLGDGGEAAIRANMRDANVNIDLLDYVAPGCDVGLTEISAEMDNLVGEDAETLAKQWIDDGVAKQWIDDGVANHGAASEELRLTTQIGKFLGPQGNQVLSKQLAAISLRRKQGSNNHDSQGEDEAEAKGRAAHFFFASTSSAAALTPRSIDKVRNIPTTSPSLPLSFPFRNHQLTSKHDGTKSCGSAHSAWHFSLSPSILDSFDSSDERAYHSLFDALQFNNPPTYKLPSRLGREEPQPHTPAFTSPFEKSVLCLPGSTAQSFKQKKKKVSQLPVIPLVSPSVTPSPPSCHTPIQDPKIQSPSISVPPTHGMLLRDRKGQLNDVVVPPPMLDLKKILKRSSSSSGFAGPTAKRRIMQPSLLPPISTTAARGIVSSKQPNMHLKQKPQSPSRTTHVFPHIRTLGYDPQVVPSDHATLTRPTSQVPRSSPRSTADKVRRSKAKAEQVRIRERLIRALPPTVIPTALKTKVKRQEWELAALRATNLIVRKQSIYGGHEAAPHSPRRSCSKSPNLQGGLGGIPRERTVIFDGSTMDWDKSREYQDGFKAQRKQGIRYPPLPRLDKSFSESQTP